MKKIMLHVRRGNEGDMDKGILIPDGYEKFFSENKQPPTHFIEVWRNTIADRHRQDYYPVSFLDESPSFKDTYSSSMVIGIAIFKIRAKD